MADSDPEPEVVTISVQANTEEVREGRKKADIVIPQNQLEIWEEEAERRGMNRSELVRVYAEAGRKMMDEYDPRRAADEDRSPLRNLIVDHVPVGSESAMSIDQITESVIDQLEDEIWDVLIEDDEINRSGNKFYQP